MRRVVITGLGAISSLGSTPEELWKHLLEGKHGFSTIESFDTSDFDVTLAAEIKQWNSEDFQISKKEARRMDLFSQYALGAANTALKDAGDIQNSYDPFRVGVLVGSGIGGFHTVEREYENYLNKGPHRVSVFFVPLMISNMAGGTIAIAHGFKGDNFAPVSACSSGNHALGEAYRKIKHGYLDACVTGGTESAITKFTLAGFNNMGALSKSKDANRLSIPFDKERNGFVMGEGAGILVLEELEMAKARGAHIYAEILGYGATDDAYHITSPDITSLGPAKSMEFAMTEAGISPTQVDYINAHGTSTPLNDKLETKAIKLAFGDHAHSLAISSTKSATGHLLGAAGAIEGVICALALENQILPGTLGYEQPDPECDLNYLTSGPVEKKVSIALSNSFGFGGHNATVAFGRYTK